RHRRHVLIPAEAVADPGRPARADDDRDRPERGRGPAPRRRRGEADVECRGIDGAERGLHHHPVSGLSPRAAVLRRPRRRRHDPPDRPHAGRLRGIPPGGQAIRRRGDAYAERGVALVIGHNPYEPPRVEEDAAETIEPDTVPPTTSGLVVSYRNNE